MTQGGMYGGTGSGAAVRGGGTSSSYGSSSSQSGGSRSTQGGQGGQARGGRRGATGAGSSQGQAGGGAGGAKLQQVWFEPRIEVGFSMPGPPASVIQTNVSKPLKAPALSSRFGTVRVSVEGDMVVLRGSVPSESDRLLAAQIAMLEPAVVSVRNELTVATPAAVPAAR
jgi:osmotically-inducible protein OsmY